MEVTNLSAAELLRLHALIAERLRALKIIRSSNNPTGDLAEYLFCKAFEWRPSGNSNPYVDAIAKDGARYQIKGRRITRYNNSRQLSAIRDFAGRHFDYLAGILFNEDYVILRAAIIPYAIVKQHARFVEHTNSHKFILRNDVWEMPGVKDVTKQLLEISPGMV